VTGRRRRQLTGWYAAAAAVLCFASVAGAARAAAGARAVTLTLDVVFFVNGGISVTLPDGTPVGTASGQPTVIPAGYYTLVLTGPGGCSELPYFELKGPGENIQNDMDLGEVRTTVTAYLAPNSTYTWTDNGLPDVVYTFETSGTIAGTTPPPAAQSPVPPPSGTQSTVGSKDVVGSGLAPFRGTLVGTVTAAGRLSLSFRGRTAVALSAGRYRLTVSDRSRTDGFTLQKAGRRSAVRVTGPGFVGKRSISLELTAGRWLVAAGSGKQRRAVVVS
jgi:hypothetical protein